MGTAATGARGNPAATSTTGRAIPGPTGTEPSLTTTTGIALTGASLPLPVTTDIALIGAKLAAIVLFLGEMCGEAGSHPCREDSWHPASPFPRIGPRTRGITFVRCQDTSNAP